MICSNSAFEQGNLDLWRYINAFIIIIIIAVVIISFMHDVLLVFSHQMSTLTITQCIPSECKTKNIYFLSTV